MITRSKLSLYLQELLKCEAYNDYAPNGLQIEGKNSIKKICTAVTASEDVITKANQMQADALIVHHGYFWRGEDPIIHGMKKQRISNILVNDLNLFAYHLPLDCHLDLGNNACLAKLFTVKEVKTHRVGNIDNLLWSGKLSIALNGFECAQFIEHKLGRSPLHLAGSDKLIQTIAWCTGAAQDYIENASALGVDAYISGEVSERTYYQAMELGIHYYAAGHHATERYGVQALGEHLSQQFGVEHHFLDSINPV